MSGMFTPQKIEISLHGFIQILGKLTEVLCSTCTRPFPFWYKGLELQTSGHLHCNSSATTIEALPNTGRSSAMLLPELFLGGT